MILTTSTQETKNGARGVLLYKAVVESLRGQIEEGVVVPGEKLPSINALCTRYGVSTITVRAALRELVTAGYLKSRPRSGIFVQKRGESKHSGLIRDSIAILTPYTEAPPASHRQAGWLEYVTQGGVERDAR